jgi:hypothetical protein
MRYGPRLENAELMTTEPRIGRSYPLLPGMRGEASFSEDHRYRWWLLRTWDRKPPLITIACNPSSAGADRDDNTIRVLERLAIRQGFGRLVMLNAYALCATDMPDIRVDYVQAVGESNDLNIGHILAEHRGYADCVVLAAWGVIPRERHNRLCELLHEERYQIACLGITQDGYPRHPLRTQTSALFPFDVSGYSPLA